MGGLARRRSLLVLAAGVATVTGAVAARASGPAIFPPPRTTTTSSTASPESTTSSVPGDSTSTTTAGPGVILRGHASTTTLPPTTTTTSAATTTTAGPTTTTTIGPGNMPPDMQAQINAVKRTPPNNTNGLVAALQPLVDLGLTPQQAAIVGMGRFPVGGRASWADDWLWPRFNGTFHLHQGNDIFAALGTPVRSPADGTLRQATDPLGGTVLFITEPGGTYYYLAHLSAYASGEPPAEKVTTGQLVGFVGNTGDAAGGPTHLHFEVHPHGGAAVDPKPFLDSWVADAIAGVPAVIRRLFPGSGRGGAGGGHLVLADAVGGAGFSAPVVPSRSELAWASAASPAGGPLELAAAQAEAAAQAIDWTAESQQATAASLAYAEAQQEARTLLAPLTPPELAVFLGTG